MINIGLFWGTRNYRNLGGWNNLFLISTKKKIDQYRLVTSKVYISMQEFFEVGDIIYRVREELEFPEKQKRSSKNDHTFGFLQTWKYFDIDTQILAEHSLADILFQHGFPFSIKRKSFIFHFENIKTLFLPIGLDWENENLSENKHFLDFIDYLNDIFQNECCLAITSHYTESLEIFKQLFPQVSYKTNLIFNDQNLLEQRSVNKNMCDDKNILFFDTSILKQKNKLYTESIEKFLDICLNLKSSDNLRPIILLERESVYRDKFIKANVIVMETSLGSEIIKKILTKSRFLFCPSNEIETDTMLNCIENNIVPLVNLFPAYQELGFKAGINSINVSLEKLSESPLGFKSKLIPMDTTKNILDQLRSFGTGNLISGEGYPSDWDYNKSFEKLASNLMGEKIQKKIKTMQPRQTLFELDTEVSLNSPAMHLVLQVDFLAILSNGEEYIYCLRRTPSNKNQYRDGTISESVTSLSLRSFFNNSDIFEKNGTRIFKDLKELTYAYEWSNRYIVTLPIHSLPSRFDTWLRIYNKEIKKFSGPFHPILKKIYILQRAVYRLLTNRPPYFK